ncbi:MAG TPA: indole-3-glycerol phosphate synthase TrpC [Myxococcaceae bacterium]|nr:indole-3-glycerol phosphate synthase TrpC [Myxococcaceae bacterium]
MNFLEEILSRKRLEVAERRVHTPDAQLEAKMTEGGAGRLWSALSGPGGPTRIIAEVKRASPSLGVIRQDLGAAQTARHYARAGAAAISVLTDGPGFGGSPQDLKDARAAVDVPLLRKDFVVDRYQLLEAKAWGADAALLIVAALERAALESLLRDCAQVGLDALVEVHDETELEVALAAGARVVGVNNRNLKTFQVDLATSERLIPRIPADVRAVAESGIRGQDEVRRLRGAGAVNFLVGEALVRAADSEALLRDLARLQ